MMNPIGTVKWKCLKWETPLPNRSLHETANVSGVLPLLLRLTLVCPYCFGLLSFALIASAYSRFDCLVGFVWPWPFVRQRRGTSSDNRMPQHKWEGELTNRIRNRH